MDLTHLYDEDDNVVHDTILKYLNEIRAHNPVFYMPIEQFYTRADLENYRKAMAWWPKSHPRSIALKAPSLKSLLDYYQPNSKRTFAQALSLRSEMIIEWIKKNDCYLLNPNETKEERKARKNREAQQRYKERHNNDPEAKTRHEQLIAERNEAMKTLDQSVEVAHNQFLTVCAERKEAMKPLDRAVEDAYSKFLAVCTERKTQQQLWKARIDRSR